MSADSNMKIVTQSPRNMKHQENILSPNDNNNPLVAEFKDTEFFYLADKGFQNNCFEETQ